MPLSGSVGLCIERSQWPDKGIWKFLVFSIIRSLCKAIFSEDVAKDNLGNG